MRKSYFDYIIPHCDLDLEESKPIFFRRQFGSWRCITMPSVVVKGPAIKRILSGQTFTGVLKFCCDLDLEHSNSISLKDTPAYDNIPSTYRSWYKTGYKKNKETKPKAIKTIKLVSDFHLLHVSVKMSYPYHSMLHDKIFWRSNVQKPEPTCSSSWATLSWTSSM